MMKILSAIMLFVLTGTIAASEENPVAGSQVTPDVPDGTCEIKTTSPKASLICENVTLATILERVAELQHLHLKAQGDCTKGQFSLVTHRDLEWPYHDLLLLEQAGAVRLEVSDNDVTVTCLAADAEDVKAYIGQ